MSYVNPRRPMRKRRDNTPIVLAVATLFALPALGYAVYKFVIVKPPVDRDLSSAPGVVIKRPTATQPAPYAPAPAATAAAMPQQIIPSAPTDPFAMADMGGMLNANVATARVCRKIRDSLELRKALVVWLFDRSPSADTRREEVLTHVKSFYPLLAKEEKPVAKPDDARLLSVVGAFAADPQFVTDEPVADADKFTAAISGIKSGSDGNVENTFKAIEAAVQKYAVYAEPPHLRSVSIVVVTDEAGDDQPQRDRVLDLVKKYSIPVYVIGSAAPFGSTGQLDAGPEGSQFAQGPESREVEWIKLDSGMGPMAMGSQETNLGPYSLTALCVASGGEYYPVNALGGGVQVPPQYAPRYLSEKEYQAAVAGNKAYAALIKASKLPAAKQITGPDVIFTVDENGVPVVRDIDMAQRPQALIKPEIDAIYDILKDGEKDRPKLTEPRLQAGYDLAMGRIMAAKVRTEGYIVLLAAFKSGRKGSKPDIRAWRLEQAEGIEKNSVLDSMAKKARAYLEGVVKDHPNTPWATAAQQELATPIGWKWVEG